MFIKALFTIIKIWTDAVFATEERIRKMFYIYRMEYILTIKKNKSHVLVGKLMQLEMIILKQCNQHLKDNEYVLSVLHGGSQSL